MRQVTAAVIVENGLLFLTRRAPGEKLAGCWELPGGKVEPGETPRECLERELLEELEMSAEAGPIVARTVYRYDHGEFEMVALACRRQSDFSLSVHDDSGWFSRGQLESLCLAPADIELVSALSEAGIW